MEQQGGLDDGRRGGGGEGRGKGRTVRREVEGERRDSQSVGQRRKGRNERQTGTSLPLSQFLTPVVVGKTTTFLHTAVLAFEAYVVQCSEMPCWRK